MTTPQPQFNVRGIPAHMIDHFWPFAEPYIKRALDHACGEFLPSDLKSFCKDRIVQLWLISEGEKVIGAVTTEIVNYPRKRHCRVITLAGSRSKEWLAELDIILCAWGKQQGCHALEAYVRKGFVPVLAQYGMQHKYSAVVKELPET